MKNRLIPVMAAAAVACSLAGCAKQEDAVGDVISVYMPDGAPAIAMSALMHDGYYATQFTVVSAATITARVSGGDADLAIIPINDAAQLYNGGADIKMLSVNTHGNLFFVGGASADPQLSDIVGKRVGVIGRGKVPDLTLRMLLDKNNIAYVESDSAVSGKVALTYGKDGPALLPLLKKGDIDYAFIAEPAATTAVKNLSTEQKPLAILLDAQQLWQQAFGSGYPQACLVAKSSLVSSRPEYVTWLLRALKSTDGWAEEHSAQAISAVKAHMESGVASTLPDALAADVISRCNIRTEYAADMRASCDAYFERLTHMQTELGTPVIAKLPGDGFYYSA